MQIKLADFIESKPEAAEAGQILRACVHCGFCTATCPTYQLTGNELDGPRGRIYLLKQLFEGRPVSRLTQRHLDRCLACRSCETTCPSGVRYGRLLDIGRELVDHKVKRRWPNQFKRRLMGEVFPYPQRFKWLVMAARLFRPLLPLNLRRRIPDGPGTVNWPAARHARKMLILPGCVQNVLAPQIDAAAAKVLDRLGISLLQVKTAGCCGALNYHLGQPLKARQFARIIIDACWPHVEQGAEAVVSTASGCGLMLKEYAALLQTDAEYARKATVIAAMTRDISEILLAEDLDLLRRRHEGTIAYQSPCTLQHGQQLAGVVEKLLQKLGFRLTEVENAHLCCGSAGVYSLLQPDLAQRLLHNKLQSLNRRQDDIIATANIGCLLHLQSSGAETVVHWIELV